MARIDPIPLEKMTAEQRRINDEISAARSGGQASGPFGLWLRTPELADRANAFGSHIRRETSAPQRLVELAVLVIARHWKAEYEWAVHEKHARRLGIDDAAIEAIRNDRRPELADAADQVAYDLAREITETRKVDDATYARAVETLGEQTVLDLVTAIGFYVMVAVVLAVYLVDVREGEKRPFE